MFNVDYNFVSLYNIIIITLNIAITIMCPLVTFCILILQFLIHSMEMSW